MSSLYLKIWGSILCGFTIFFLVACTGKPVNTGLPPNHPANPDAQETAFIPPPNPFQVDRQMETVGKTPMTEKKQVPPHQHQMTHQMDQISKDSMSTPETDVKRHDHQH